MLETIIHWDEMLLTAINGWHTPWLDSFFSFITNKKTWIPLYILLLVYFVWKLGYKKAIGVAVCTIVAVGLSDLISVHAFKDVFLRLRPCHQEHLRPLLHLVNNKCGGTYGFVSSHAANHFAMAWIFFFVLKPIISKWSYVFFIWAGLIALSRVYLGVHFPTDVLVGGALGSIIALAIYQVFVRLERTYFQGKVTTS